MFFQGALAIQAVFYAVAMAYLVTKRLPSVGMLRIRHFRHGKPFNSRCLDPLLSGRADSVVESIEAVG